jgi:hypothetical protein
MNIKTTAFILLVLICSLLAACSGGANTPNAVVGDDSKVTPIPITWKRDVTTNDIASIKWLEGTWRGAGDGKEPFFERYTFDGTTLTEESFTDNTLDTVSETTKYVLINGEFRHTSKDAKRVAASEITDDHIQFVPVVGGGNKFRFEKQPKGKWRAVLEFPATADQPAKQITYNMEPYKKP